MDLHPAAVAAFVEAVDRIEEVPRRLAIQADVLLRPEAGRGVAHADADTLRRPAPSLVNLSCRQPCSADRCLRLDSDIVDTRQRWLCAGQCHLIQRLGITTR